MDVGRGTWVAEGFVVSYPVLLPMVAIHPFLKEGEVCCSKDGKFRVTHCGVSVTIAEALRLPLPR